MWVVRQLILLPMVGISLLGEFFARFFGVMELICGFGF